ncbi:MAG: hypothetical protein ACLFV3_05700 [Phycisphaeraceae bacterium]
MHIDLRDRNRRPLFQVQADMAHLPTVVRAAGDERRAVHLDWDRAMDDGGRLRRCPACGCGELFVRKRVPQVTVFVAVLLSAAAAMVLFGYGRANLAIITLAVVVVADVLIFLFAPRSLVCYRCHSEYRGIPIAAGHSRWDSGVDERYRPARD